MWLTLKFLNKVIKLSIMNIDLNHKVHLYIYIFLYIYTFEDTKCNNFNVCFAINKRNNSYMYIDVNNVKQWSETLLECT